MKRIHPLLVALAAATTPSAALADCYQLPATANNVSKGDIILTSSGGNDDPIKALLSAIGQKFTHTGVALSATRVRHNTMDAKVPEQSTSGVDAFPERFAPSALQNGTPGIITSDISKGSWLSDSSIILTGPGGNDSTKRQNVANQMERFVGNYRLYAYTDMFWKDPYSKRNNNGNMCSGTVAYAQLKAGYMTGDHPATREYDEATRMKAATALSNTMEKRVAKEFETRVDEALTSSSGRGVQVIGALFGIPVKPVVDKGTDKKKAQVARQMANQIVNCMAFNRCDDVSSRWKDVSLGKGNTVSPDDLMVFMQMSQLIAVLNDQPNPDPYKRIEPVRVSSAFYCCRDNSLAEDDFFDCR